jgi:hypothetical protein
VFDATATGVQTYDFICTLPLKFMHHLFKQMPLVKGCVCRLVINTHLPTTTAYTNTAANPSVYTAPVVSTLYGFNPLQMVVGSTTAGTGLVINTATSLTLRGVIGNTLETSCKLRIPMVTMSPQAEAKYLASKEKEVFYEDYIYNPSLRNVAPSASNINWQVSAGQSRVRRVVVIPQTSASTTADLGNGTLGVSALNSPLTSAGGCTASPYAGFGQLNVALSSQNIWQSSLSYRWEQWLQEIGYSNSINGGYDASLVTTSISEADYYSLYPIVDVNLSRHSQAEDEVSKSVGISFQNLSTRQMDYHIYLVYGRSFKMDVSTGQFLV